ncbi:translocation/assembly module TamB domain-containing protein [Bartonella taylorii]|uniref:Translocation/assembly module TamB domain-containing protein n=1 Tax=Bartonella taylorii TaxID=33046 RepID=A0A9Q8YX17_BARTA|nr:translocation/assembly module TamB domain-containing protein [Bartonella taylorii]OPB35208.1 autotransporter secretion inner membrane proteinTamB [Bartonella taylorii]USP02508.1 translocation/assembly module TamB domain-containing protein [Bartonella taylorii]
MKKNVRLSAFLFGLSFFLVSAFVFAQKDNSSSSEATVDDRSWFVSLIERRLSAPNRQVRLYNMRGTLFSQTSIDAITVSDKKGVWLKITNAKMDWNRLALLRGRMDINQLSAERITFLRKPHDNYSLIASLEAGKFSLPKLPLAISIDTLTAKHVIFEQELLGFSADVSLKGNLTLANGDFDVDIAAHRLDAPGSLSILTKISDSNRTAKIDISADESQNGILANIFNIEKRPALNLSIRGDGTFDDLVVSLFLKADHHPVLDGNVILASVAEGHSFSTKLVGTLGPLIPPQYRSLFESDMTLKAEARMTKEGVKHLDHMVIQSKTMNILANAEITTDGFLRRLFIDGKMALDKENDATHLSASEMPMRADNLALNIDYGREGQQSWNGRLVVHQLSNKNIRIRDAIFDMGGVSENLDNAASRHVGIQIKGTLQGIEKSKSILGEGLGQTVHVHLDTDVVSKKPVLIHDFSVTGQGFSAWLKGKMNRFVFKGDLGLKAQTLAPFSLLSRQSLSGSTDIKAKGTIGLIDGVFDLELSGMADNMKIGVEPFDRFFKGNFILSGGAAYDTASLILRRLDLKSQYANIKADGYFSSESAKMDFYAQISDLAKLDSRMNGALTVQSTARGRNNLIKFNTNAHVSEAFLVGKKLKNTTLTIKTLMDNTSPSASLTGSIKGEGTFSEKPLHLSASFKDSNQIRKLEDINIRGGSAKITGDLSQKLGGFVKGALHIDADDISVLAALFLQEGSGKVKGDFIFDEQNGRQKANLKAHVDRLSFAKNKIKKLEVKADVFDPLGMAQFEGFINADHIQTPFMMVNRLNAYANGNDGQTVFNVKAMLPNDTNARLSGRMVTARFPEGIKREMQIETIDVKQHNLHATLPKSATIVFDKDGMTINELGIAINGGKVILAGNVQDTLNLHLTMNALPAALANLWKSNLGAAGTLTGQVIIRGPFKKPDVTYDIKGEGLTTHALQDKKVMPFVLAATGKTVEQNLILNANLMGEGVQAQAQGRISLDKNTLDLHVNLQDFPARLVNSFIEGQALGGTIVGKVDIGGTMKDPSAHFELSSQNLTAMTHKGPMSINMNTRGSYKKSTFHIENIIATGDKGLDLSINGPVSFNGSEARLNVKGTMPLAFVDLLLAKRGAHVTGTVRIDATLNGELLKPQLVGDLSIVDGSFFDSKTNVGLNNITIEGKSNGDHILIEKASASSSEGGSISASGRISHDGETDLVFNLDHANYNDGSMILATLSGKMTMTGHFLGNLVIGGDVIVEKAEVLVPDHFRNAKFLNIKNKNLTKSIQKTLERADVKITTKTRNISQESSSVMLSDMRITAHNQFFVRGRGLDTELGGRINLAGPLNDVQPVGEFRMIRGRFDILSQHLNFDQGQASFSGNLNPTVYFVTNNNSGDIRVTVTISGTIDNLDINFSSQPNLPQDEILARLIFNRSLNELSPFQIAQLAAAAADLAGASNTSLLNALRAKIGLDDLDVIVDEKGNTGLRVGRYIHNNIYLGFEAGSDGKTKGTINLDISRNLKAKGAIGNEKNSSVGLFYERDY